MTRQQRDVVRAYRAGSGPAKAVLLHIAMHARGDGWAYLGVPDLAAATELGEKTVRRALTRLVFDDELNPDGVVERDRRHRANGSRTVNGYRILWERLEVTATGSLEVRETARQKVRATARRRLEVRATARQDLEVRATDNLEVGATARAPVTVTARDGLEVGATARSPADGLQEGEPKGHSDPPHSVRCKGEESSSSSSPPGQSPAGATDERAGNGDEDEDENGVDPERTTAWDRMGAVVREVLTAERVPNEELLRGLQQAVRPVATGRGQEWQPRRDRPPAPWKERPWILEQALVRVISRTRVDDPFAELQRYVRYYTKVAQDNGVPEPDPPPQAAAPQQPDRSAEDQRAAVERELADRLLEAHPDEAKRYEQEVDAELDQDPTMAGSPGRKSAKRAMVRRRALSELGGVRKMAGAA